MRAAILKSTAVQTLAVAFATVAVATPLRAQSADEILDGVRQHYDDRTDSVENYTVVQDVDGMRQVHYYERRDENGHAVFAPVGPFAMMVESGAVKGVAGDLMAGNMLGALKDIMLQSAENAGMSQLQKQIQGMGDGVFADFIGPLLTPEPGTAPGDALGSLTDGDHLKAALVKGAKRAALHEAERALLNAAAPQIALLLQGMQSGGVNRMLGQLQDDVSHGTLPTPGQLFNGNGGAAGGPGMAGSGLNGLVAGAGALAGAALMKKEMDATKDALSADGMESMDLGPLDLADELEGAAEVTGTEAVDGHDCWVLSVSDASKIGDVASNDFRSPKLRVWIDRDLYVLRRMRMEGEARMNGEWTPDHDRDRAMTIFGTQAVCSCPTGPRRRSPGPPRACPTRTGRRCRSRWPR